jgi:hypothetical protein
MEQHGSEKTPPSHWKQRIFLMIRINGLMQDDDVLYTQKQFKNLYMRIWNNTTEHDITPVKNTVISSHPM